MTSSNSIRVHDYVDGDRARAVQRVLVVEMLLNLLVAAAKGVYGLWSGSLVIAADAVHSLVDAAANIGGMVALRWAGAPPDPHHPYGHHKIEIVAAAGIGVLIGIGAFEFGWSAIDALIHGSQPPARSPIGFAVIVGTWGINMFVATWEYRKARQLDSAYLAADAAHTASDVAVTAAVLVAYSASYMGIHWTDPVGALLVMVVIVRAGWLVLTRNLAVLLDRAVLEPARVRTVALAVPGVTGCHRVRSRGTERLAYLDLHVQVEGTLSLHAAHEISHQVEDALRTEMPSLVDVTIHIEPAGDPPEAL
ncbi:cation diffusion facilitator family transporter [Haliangium sp.]|uniref:cation diffusion facilitator family transporter n=1 Tax=Haliangium sp. TaxID=2663208 RepID=UPI003D0AE242